MNLDDDCFWTIDGLIYFCGDSFYGDWSLEDFEDFVKSLNVRLEELKNERHN